MVNEVQLKSGEIQTLTDEEMKMRNANLQTQGIQDTGTPGETGGTVVTPIEDIQVQEVKQETPIINSKPEIQPEVPEIKEIESIKTPEPVQKVQEVKNQSIINEQDEITVQEQKKQQATTEFQQMLDSGASTEELASFSNRNEQFTDSFRASVRTKFKNKGNVQFFNKYNGASNESIYSAVKNGAIKVGSERYNMLPEAQRQSFEQFKTIKEAPEGIPTTKEQVFDTTSPENTVDFSNIENFINKMFSSDLRAKAEEMRNDDRVVNLSTELNTKASELEKFDLEGIKATKELEKDLADSGYTPAQIRAAVSDYTADRTIQRMGMVSEYNRVQGDIASIKDDIESDLELFKYEDQQAKEKYSMLFSIYESRRSEQRADESAIAEREFEREMIAEERDFQENIRLDEQAFDLLKIEDQRSFDIAMAEFEEQNKQIAIDKALQNSKELYKFQNQIQQGNVKGQWQSRYDGLYFLHDNGKVEKKINGNMDFQSDGVSVYTYTGEEGQPIIEYKDISGNVIGASTSNTQFTQKQVDLLNAPVGTRVPTRLNELSHNNPGGKECAEYINDIFGDSLGTRLGSTYQSKLDVANEKKGGLGSVAVWQPNPSGEYSKWGHVGVIVGESKDGKSWHIKSSNINGEGVISVDEVPKSVIDGYKSTSLYDKPIEDKTYNTAQTKFLESTLLEDFNSNDKIKDTAESLGLRTEDFFAYKANNIDPMKKDELNSILTGIDDLLAAGDGDGLSDALGLFSTARFFKNTSEQSPELYVAGTDAADFEAQFKALESKLTISNLDLMTGILTDKDLEVLKGANTALSLSMSEKQFKKELDKIKEASKNALDVFSALDNNFHTDDTGKKWTREGIADELTSLIDSGKITEQEAKEYIKENNIKF